MDLAAVPVEVASFAAAVLAAARKELVWVQYLVAEVGRDDKGPLVDLAYKLAHQAWPS